MKVRKLTLDRSLPKHQGKHPKLKTLLEAYLELLSYLRHEGQKRAMLVKWQNRWYRIRSLTLRSKKRLLVTNEESGQVEEHLILMENMFWYNR